MNQEMKLTRIAQLLSRFRDQVQIMNADGEFNINKHAENILIHMLNSIYECDFENVNYVEGKNYPAIDLRDSNKRIAIQVTATSDLNKVKHTLIQFIDKKLYEQFDRILVYIITEKQQRYDLTKVEEILEGKISFAASDIIDRGDLYKELNRQNNFTKIEKVCGLLEKQFADNRLEYEKWDSYCKGLQEYDQYIINLFKFLEIKGFSPRINSTIVKLNLEKVYVPLQMKPESNNVKNDDGLGKVMAYSLEEVFYKHKNLVVLGDPGSGKSTVLKHFALSICSNRSTKTTLSDFVPVVIKGSEYARYYNSTLKKLGEYIIDHLDKKYERLFAEKLEENSLIVIIDGIDEINDSTLRHKVANSINVFVSQYPNIHTIVSSRIVGYNETRLIPHFSHVFILRFQDEQIKLFVRNWHSSFSEDFDKDSASLEREADKVYEAIRSNDSVYKMASNPLLITIIALIQYQGVSLPEKRINLYDVATTTFLDNWVKQRDFQRSSTIDKDRLRELLGPVAFYMHSTYSSGLISEFELKSKLQSEIENIDSFLNISEVKKEVNSIINFLREDAGFLYEKGFNENGQSVFGFVHQTFQEFFSAIEFNTRWKERKVQEDIAKYVFNPSWNEIIKLCSAVFKLNEVTRIGRQQATAFVDDILNVMDPLPEINRPLKLVVQILREDTEIETGLFNRIINKVLWEILSQEHESSIKPVSLNKEVIHFMHNIGELLHSKIYQLPLIANLIKELKDERTFITIKKNIVQMLMDYSEIDAVSSEIINICKSNDLFLKLQVYDYSVVYPASNIVCKKEFKSEIVNFVNSPKFFEIYTGKLPVQYTVSFDIESIEPIKKHFENVPVQERVASIKLKIVSVRLLDSMKMKEDLVRHYVFSGYFKDHEDMIFFINLIKKEYPEMNFPQIDEYIANGENYDLNPMHDERVQILKYKSVRIFTLLENLDSYIFTLPKSYVELVFPFKKRDLLPYFKNDTEQFIIFSKVLVLMMKGIPLDGFPNDRKEFLAFTKFFPYLDFRYEFQILPLIIYSLRRLCCMNNN